MTTGQPGIGLYPTIVLGETRLRQKSEGGQVIMSNGRTLDVARRRKEEFVRQITK
jgi:hypothetical protein